MASADHGKLLSQGFAILATIGSIMSLLSIGHDARFIIFFTWAASWALMYETCAMYESMLRTCMKQSYESELASKEREKTLHKQIAELTKELEK